MATMDHVTPAPPDAPAGGGFAARFEPLAPLTGILAAILIFAGFIVGEGDVPDDKAPAAEWTAYFDDSMDSIYVGVLLIGFGMIFFLWFLGTLRARLTQAEGGVGRLAGLTFGGGLGMLILLAGAVGMQVSGAFAADEEIPLADESFQLLYWVGDGLFLMSWFFGSVFLFATGLGVLRFGLLPKWLGWVTLAMGILGPWWFTGWIIFIFLLPIWLIVVAIMLWRSAATA